MVLLVVIAVVVEFTAAVFVGVIVAVVVTVKFGGIRTAFVFTVVLKFSAGIVGLVEVSI